MNINPIHEKWEAFGWHVIDVDGHNMDTILDALDEAEKTKGKPTMIIANTTKGKGSVIFEDKVGFHGVTPTEEEFEQAVKEINNG